MCGQVGWWAMGGACGGCADGFGDPTLISIPTFVYPQCHKLNYGRRADCCQCGRPKGPDSLYPPHLYDDYDGIDGGGGRVSGWWFWLLRVRISLIVCCTHLHSPTHLYKRSHSGRRTRARCPARRSSSRGCPSTPTRPPSPRRSPPWASSSSTAGAYTPLSATMRWHHRPPSGRPVLTHHCGHTSYIHHAHAQPRPRPAHQRLARLRLRRTGQRGGGGARGAAVAGPPRGKAG